MQTHKPSMTGCKRDAKATWAVRPRCNLAQNGSSDRTSPHWIARRLFVSFWFSLFSDDVWGKKDPLCVKPQELKAKLDLDAFELCVCVCLCVRESDGMRDEYTTHKLPGSMFFYDTPHKQCFLEKNSVTAAKFADSLLKISKTEQENDKIIFPCFWVCSVAHILLPVHKQ